MNRSPRGKKAQKKTSHLPSFLTSNIIMPADGPPSPPPRRRQPVPTTAVRATSTVADALPIGAGAASPQRRHNLFQSSAKRGKPKTTPERGCRSPLKKSSKVHRGPRASVNLNRLSAVDAAFEPVILGPSKGPSPVSVANQTDGDTSASQSKNTTKNTTTKRSQIELKVLAITERGRGQRHLLRLRILPRTRMRTQTPK